MATKNKDLEPLAELQTVVWKKENHKPSVHDKQASDSPPPWAHGTWGITRFEVLDKGATLHLWWDSTPITRGG